jgi:DNA replication protein DnaD
MKKQSDIEIKLKEGVLTHDIKSDNIWLDIGQITASIISKVSKENGVDTKASFKYVVRIIEEWARENGEL